MIEYVSDELLDDAKGRARIPDAAFSTAQLLKIASNEFKSYLMPLVASTQENYYETDVDQPLSADLTTVYRVPSRALGGALREVSFLDASGATIDVPRIDETDLEQATWGFVAKGAGVQYVNRVSYTGPVTLRLTIALTPSLLCQAANAAIIKGIAGNVLTLGAMPASDNPLPTPADGGASGNMAGKTSFDLIKSTPGFELVAFDQAGTCNGTTLTLGSVPKGLAVGDFVALANYSPVPMAPVEFHPLLAQSIAAELLHRLGQSQESQEAFAKREAIKTQVLPLVQNRIRGAPKSLTARRGILACGRRW